MNLKDLYAKLGELYLNSEVINSQIVETKRRIIEIINSKSQEVKSDVNIP